MPRWVTLERGRWTEIGGPAYLRALHVSDCKGSWKVEIRDRGHLMFVFHLQPGMRWRLALAAPALRPRGRIFRLSRSRTDVAPTAVVEIR